MITVHISLPSFWVKDSLNERGWIELGEGAKLSDALKEIKMPMLVARALLICVNGALSTKDEELSDGDCIAFFPIPSGG
jgi:molybdopterin converting factor small subunit